MYSSDTEKNDIQSSGSRSNITTDDEFYSELMDAPPEFEDHLIPDDCDDEVKGIEHLVKCLDYRFNAYPAVHMGTLKQAVHEAFSSKDISERRPCLIYINHDRGVYTNLFCRQLLCNGTIIEYLMNNYVIWAWDITFKSNEQMLNQICKTVFPPWTTEKQFDAKLIDQYPLLLGVYRDINGDYAFQRFIEGSSKRPNVNEFLAQLVTFKEEFAEHEQKLEKAKEEAKQQMLHSLFQARYDPNRPKHPRDREYIRSLSMHPHAAYGDITSRHHQKLSRFFSNNMTMRSMDDERLFTMPPSGEDIRRVLEQFHVDPDDDADDEDDERTPTVERPAPKFS